MQMGSSLTIKVVHICHATSTEVCYIYKTRNELVHTWCPQTFISSLYQFNMTIDLYYTDIGHFRALYQMYLSLVVDIGRGGVLITNKSDMS